MSVCISPGNSKLGKHIPNISLTPCATCNPEAPCRSKCYAMKAYRQYPNVKKAWDLNTALVKLNDIAFFEEVCRYLREHNHPKYFRWHVAGDILNQDYLEGMKIVALNHPNTRFLAFTKKNLDFSNLPANLQIVASQWPGWNNPVEGLPKAWMQDGTESRENKESFLCPGKCDNCKVCWHLSETKQDVTFLAH